MENNGTVPPAPVGLPPEEVLGKAIEAFQPLVEELEVSAVVEGDWPPETVRRVLLISVVRLMIVGEGLERTLVILDEEIESLRGRGVAYLRQGHVD